MRCLYITVKVQLRKNEVGYYAKKERDNKARVVAGIIIHNPVPISCVFIQYMENAKQKM